MRVKIPKNRHNDPGAGRDKIDGWVDTLSQYEIAGWVANLDQPDTSLFVDIEINGRLVATVGAELFRKDIADLGVSDGRSGFHFAPIRYLDRVVNDIDVYHAGTRRRVPNGKAQLKSLSNVSPAAPCGADDLNIVSRMTKQRWQENEDASGLTWGRLMTGDSFTDRVLEYQSFSTETRVCELGPGYGRLLKTMLGRRLEFESYDGVELSPARVKALNHDFDFDARIRFQVGDIEDFKLETSADLLLCSSTFEHLYPDCSKGLRNAAGSLRAGGRVCIDFILRDSDDTQSEQRFEQPTNTFVRIYTANEIQELFSNAGLREIELTTLTLGEGDWGAVERIFATATTGGA